MAELITVYEKDSGKQRTIPARWLELDHPQFKQFRKTPPKTTGDKNPTPESATKKNTTESEG